MLSSCGMKELHLDYDWTLTSGRYERKKLWNHCLAIKLYLFLVLINLFTSSLDSESPMSNEQGADLLLVNHDVCTEVCTQWGLAKIKDPLANSTSGILTMYLFAQRYLLKLDSGPPTLCPSPTNYCYFTWTCQVLNLPSSSLKMRTVLLRLSMPG